MSLSFEHELEVGLADSLGELLLEVCLVLFFFFSNTVVGVCISGEKSEGQAGCGAFDFPDHLTITLLDLLNIISG